MSEWFSVKDRLPEKPGRYLVSYLRISNENITKKVVDTLKWENYGPHLNPKSRWHGTDRIRGKYITHWMPLPKPPENI